MVNRISNIQALFFSVIFALFCGGVYAQGTTVKANRVIADSVKIGSRWVYLIDTDSSFASVSHRAVPTTKAVKDYLSAQGTTLFSIIVGQNSHGFSLLDPICLGANWRLANVTDEDSLHIGIVSEVISTNYFKVQFAGKLYAPAHGYTVGKPYFVQNDGTFAQTSEANKINDIAFTVLSADTILIHEQRPVSPSTDQNGIYSGSNHVPSGVIAYVDNFQIRDSSSRFGLNFNPENDNMSIFGDSCTLLLEAGAGWVFTDNNSVKKGIMYGASGYVTDARSFADKGYVDAAVAAAGVADGDKGDITVSSGIWTIDNDAVTSAKIAADAVGSSEIATSAVTTTEILDGTILTTDLAFTVNGGSGTANYLAYWTATNTLAADADFQFNGSTVGIGVAPVSTAKLFVQGTNTASTDFAGIFENSSGSDILQIRNDAYVGVNNATIVERLSVKGGVYLTSSGGTQFFRLRESDGASSFGTDTPSGTYRVQIRGFGATSSTYALRLINSSATTLAVFRDDATVGIGVDAAGNAYLNIGASTTSKACIGLPEGSVPTSPTVGDIWNSSATNTLQYSQSSLNTSLSGTIFTGTANANTNNTSTETSITPTGIGTLTLPANFLTSGKTIRLKIAGTYTTDAVAPTLVLKFKFGSTSIIATSATTLASAANGYWEGNFIVTCRTTGASGTFASFGAIDLSSAEGTEDKTVKVTASPTIDTTSSQAITVTAQWGAADADNSITTTLLTVETLN